MKTVYEKIFPDGIPEFLSFSDFGKLLGVSCTQAAKIARSRPDMLVTLPTMKAQRVRPDLYFEIVGKKKSRA